MIKVTWDDRFKKIFKKWSKKHPDLIDEFKDHLALLTYNPFSVLLKTHALHSELNGLYATRITYRYRLIFGFLDDEKTMFF
jgi:mRNA-degrading endonuclease YafQ of YafQ-DinJ toxin-antitoxin module